MTSISPIVIIAIIVVAVVRIKVAINIQRMKNYLNIFSQKRMCQHIILIQLL